MTERAADGAERWANVVLQDRAIGVADYEDELRLSGGSTLTLREPYTSAKVHATISLE